MYMCVWVKEVMKVRRWRSVGDKLDEKVAAADVQQRVDPESEAEIRSRTQELSVCQQGCAVRCGTKARVLPMPTLTMLTLRCGRG